MYPYARPDWGISGRVPTVVFAGDEPGLEGGNAVPPPSQNEESRPAAPEGHQGRRADELGAPHGSKVRESFVEDFPNRVDLVLDAGNSVVQRRDPGDLFGNAVDLGAHHIDEVCVDVESPRRGESL